MVDRMASAADLVNSATSEKLPEMDWAQNIHICELVAHDQRVAKEVVKALKKRLSSKHANTQLYAVLLLEMLMNNIGENIHNNVVDSGILPILVKIVKKKTETAVRERIFLLLDATQTSLGGASGKFPQYYTAYYDLVSAGVQFAQSPATVSLTHLVSEPNQPPDRSWNVPLNQNRSALTEQNRSAPPNQNRRAPENGELSSSTQDSQEVPESSIIQKASNALEVLKEVLDAVESQRSEGAKDEFTLDLVEQCSFQKQRVMHLVMASRDEKVVSRAIELNEQLQKVLTRHDMLLSAGPTLTVDRVSREEEGEEEEEPEQLFRRLRKGKACARPEDEERVPGPHVGPGEMQNRPLIRPLLLEGSGIPPPPAKHVEREKYFQENKSEGRALSIHSRNASSSRSGDSD